MILKYFLVECKSGEEDEPGDHGEGQGAGLTQEEVGRHGETQPNTHQWTIRAVE